MGLIRNARILMFLSPLMDKLGEQLPMTKNVHGLIQTLLTVAQMLNGVSTMVPVKYRVWVAVGVSAVQGIIAVLNHFDSSVIATATAADGSTITVNTEK